MELILIILYTIPLSFIGCYSLVQLHLVWLYFRKKPDKIKVFSTEKFTETVTIQLPIFNEMYVVERLFDSIALLDFPKNQLEIQVLDDSTDETFDIVKKKVEALRNQGFDIIQLHRKDRTGYKAGALAEATPTAKGTFIAIFDADFVPDSSFLKKTLPYFQDSKIGMIQTRWGHLNTEFSVMTCLQAFGLDAHFSVEQKGRNQGGHFMNFNGTAGIWRKSCIQNAGGWQADTLTEDLDLSYRAQLKGWKFHFLESVESPAELPAEINALRTQQRRWTKGAAECARKHLPNILKNKDLSFLTKFHAVFHLLNSGSFIAVLFLSLLSVPIQYIAFHSPEYHYFFKFVTVFHGSLLTLGIFYWVSFRQKHGFGLFMQRFPVFLSFMMGLSLHNTLAVLEGYFGKKSPFIRTPKFNLTEKNRNWKTNFYVNSKVSSLLIFEFIFMFFFGWACVQDIFLRDVPMFVFHSLLTFGFASLNWFSLKHHFFYQ
jgi:cellulose synthase/poly-beta-1,6-N-acetylglucosamine synthase-like glycosyltransferase